MPGPERDPGRCGVHPGFTFEGLYRRLVVQIIPCVVDVIVIFPLVILLGVIVPTVVPIVVDVAKQWYAAVQNNTGETREFKVFAICSADSSARIKASPSPWATRNTARLRQVHQHHDHVHWHRLADGKLVERCAARDDLGTLIQLGIIDPPGKREAAEPG